LYATTSFLDSVTAALPVFFIAKYFPQAIVGYYALAVRVAAAPLAFISEAVHQVHLKKVADLIHNGQDATVYLGRITFTLAAFAVPPTVILMTLGPSIFQYVFGGDWGNAGELLAILMPSLAVKFVVSTVSGTLAASRNNRLYAIWKVCAFIITLGMFISFGPRLCFRDILIMMMVTDLILYVSYYLLIWRAARAPGVCA
jgi:O-antigen/teichoic acid export membrane protein